MMPSNNAVLNVVSQVGVSYKLPFCKGDSSLFFFFTESYIWAGSNKRGK